MPLNCASNVSCTICKNVFTNSDTIYITNCGHVFHFSCVNSWTSSYRNCPQCRSYNPTISRIYLNFGDSHEYEKIVGDLNTQIESSKEEVKNVRKKNEQKDRKIDDIKRLYNISEQWRAELQDKIQKLSDEKEKMGFNINEMQFLKTYTETLEKENGVQQLFEKINEFNTANLKLKKNLSQSEKTNIILNQKVEMLEHRLKQVNLHPQRQCTESINKAFNQNINEMHKKRTSIDNRRRPTAKINGILNPLAERKPLRLTQGNDCRIIVTNFPKNILVYPLKCTVILLAAKMSAPLAAEDISNVNIIDQKRSPLMSNNINLMIEFTNIVGKTQFLTLKNRLKFDTATKLIQIKEYIDEAVYPVFMYANRNLRANGYEYICCRENKVYAKKKLHDTEEILIKSRADVDNLLGGNIENITIDIDRTNLESLVTEEDLSSK